MIGWFMSLYAAWLLVCLLWLEPRIHQWIEQKTGIKFRRQGSVHMVADGEGLTRKKFNVWLLTLGIKLFLFVTPVVVILLFVASQD